MKKRMSLTKQIFIRNIVCGIAWIITGLTLVFESEPLQLVRGIALIIIMIARFYVEFSNKEQEDEMAEKHMNLAKARSLDYAMLVLIIFGVVAIYVDITFDFRKVFFFVLGLLEFIIGITFLNCEKVGE